MANLLDQLDIFGLGRAAGDALELDQGGDSEAQALLDRITDAVGPAAMQGLQSIASRVDQSDFSQAAARTLAPGARPEDLATGLSGAARYFSQSPLTDAAVTGTQTYLDLLEGGTPEGEAIRRAIGLPGLEADPADLEALAISPDRAMSVRGGGGRETTPESALGRLSENALDYLIPGGNRPENLSFGDIEQMDMTDLEALLADAGVGMLDLAPLAFRGGRRVLRFPTQISDDPIPIGESARQALANLMDTDMQRIQRAPAVQRRMGQNAPVRYGSFEEIPQDSVEMLLGSLDPQSREFLMTDPDAREYVTRFLEHIESSADNIAREIAQGAPAEALKQHANTLTKELTEDLLIDPEIAEGLTNEVARRAYAVGSQARRSPTQRVGTRLASLGGPGEPLGGRTGSQPFLLGYNRGSPRGLTSSPMPEISDLATQAGHPDIGEALLRQAPDAQERMNARNLLELARERVRLASRAENRNPSGDIDEGIINQLITEDEAARVGPTPRPPGRMDTQNPLLSPSLREMLDQ